MKIQGTLREYPAGTPAVGMGVSIKREIDDVEIGTDTTDADGRWSYQQNGHPGPWYWTATDTAATPDVVRLGSSYSYGSGGAYSLYELPIGLRALGTGVVEGYGNELAVTYDAAGLDLDVATGAVLANGLVGVWHTAAEHTVVTSRDATNPKACYLVVEFTGLGESEEGKIVLKDTCGSAAASPVLPALTQTDATWQEPLATFTLPNSGSTTLSNVTDARSFPAESNPVVSSIVRRTDPTSEATTTSTTGADATSLTTTVTLVDGVTYDIEARAFLVSRIDSAANTAQVAIYINGTSNIGAYITHDSTTDMGIGNVHTLSGVAGTGASISCGVRIKVSAGTMTYNVGYLLVIATPRS
jgi:hypothetical protein